MVKHLSKLLLLVALCVPWALRAQSTLTVCDGTATNIYVPVCGYYCDAYLRSQSIYPSSMLTALVGTQISQLEFYTSQSSVNWGSSSFTVKIGETSQSSLSAWDESTTMTTVYTGSLSISGGRMSVVFDSPYEYSGGNLLVEVCNTNRGSYVSSTFYGVDATGGSFQGYSYSSLSAVSGSTRNFLPKVTIGYELPSNCPRPTGILASNLQATSATISWTAGGSESAWNLKYVEDGETDTTTVNGLTSESYSFTSLSANTTYYVYVQANCGGSDGVSSWTLGSFTTSRCDDACTYQMIFTDSYGDGWNGGSINVTQGAWSQDYTLASGSSLTTDVDICTGQSVTFTYSAGIYSDENSFELRDQTSAVVFSFSDGSTSDDASYTNATPCVLPNCPAVTHLTATATGSTTASVTWTAGDAETAWNMKYVADGSTDTTYVNDLTSVSASLSSLSANTTYYIYVQANCGGSDGVSEWTEGSFTTDCDYTSVPYVEDFESTSTGTIPSCWKNYVSYASYYASYPSVSSSQYLSGSHSLALYAHYYSYSKENIIALPTMQDINTLMITYMGKYSSSSPDTMQVGVMEDSVFIPIQTLLASELTSSFVEYNVSFDGYNGTGSRIAFRIVETGYEGYYFIDDIVVEEIPSCGHVENIAVDALTSGAAQLSWNSSSYGTYVSAQVEYKLQSASDWTVAGTTTDSTYLLTGLSANTAYDVRVKAICSGNDESVYEAISIGRL